MMKNMSALYSVLAATLIIVAILILLLPKKVSTFEECVKSGRTAVGTYPKECTADGQTFTQGVAIPKNTGIRGKITIGPQCAAETSPTKIGCEDKPYKITLEAVLKEGNFQKTFSSNADGNYKAALLPGDYSVSRTTECENAFCSDPEPQNVTVVEGKYADINFTFDTGIR